MTSLDRDVIAEQFDSPAYQLLNKIGEGGFGRVYRAKQTNTGQIVAIKFLSVNSEFDDAKRARYNERFERETLLGSRLQHPNIVRLLDKGSCAELLYAVFEYVDGKSLKETLAESGTLSPVAAAEVMSQVLDALAHAHQQGVIHRDIKPANIMLSKSGTKTHAKVLDFGIGTLVNEARLQDYKSITLTQETLGTPSYSAPEQLRGEPPTLKTDLYVWGLVFIECLTGQPAMSGASIASVFHKQLSQSHVPLPASIVGHPLAALLRRVLHKKAHERCVNAQELYQDLSHINFSNLVGDMAAAKEQQINHDQTLLNTEYDQTIISNKGAFHTGLTERKQITAMSINLSAHAVLNENLDYEVVDTLLRDQKNQCLDTAVRYGAYHVGTLADSLLFYFGYPTVSDNDSRLCARTALDIISSLQKRNALLKISQGVELDVRIGIHTDLVTCYADATPEGNTANIAMQLARLAETGKILCSEESQKNLQTYIEFEPAQSAVLGINKTDSVLYHLTAERHVEAFGFLRGAQNNHAFIGRETELKQLNELLTQCLSENKKADKLAHIYGEAGVGKSRLIIELRNSVKKMSYYVAQCLPEHQNNALYPILNIIKYKFSLDTLAPERALQKLRNEIVKLAPEKEQDAIPVLSAWLGLPLPKDLPVTALSPDLQKQVLFDILILLLLGNGAQATLFIFEDMHWADPTCIEFIASFTADKRFMASNTLFISTSRQPMPDSLTAYGFKLLKLGKLTEKDTREFVHSLFGKQNISANLLDVVVNRSDGIPLFIEELVDMLKQKGLVHKLNGIYDFTSPDKLDQVPSSLRDSLQQKLDTLVSAKETAQLAATIGRRFDYDLLVAASNRSEAQVQNDLHELIEAELIYQQRKVSGDSYIFKHALVKDAAYEGTNGSNKINNHFRIALSIESSSLPTNKANLDLLASHYRNANEYAKSVKFGIEYASFLLKKSVFKGTKAYVDLIAEENVLITDHQDKLNNKLKINKLLTLIIMATEGYGSEKVKELNKKNEELSKEILDSSNETCVMESHSSLWQTAQAHHMLSERGQAFEIASKLVADARDVNSRRRLVDSLPLMGLCLTTDGRLIDSVNAYEEAIMLYDEEIDSEICHVNGIDPKCHALVNLALALALLERFEESQKRINEAKDLSDKLNHGLCIAICHCYQMYILAIKGDKTSALAQETIQNNFFKLNPELSFLQGYSQAIIEWAKNETAFQEEFSTLRLESGQTYLHSFYETLLALSHKSRGNIDLSEKIISKAIRWCDRSGELAFKKFIANNQQQ